MKALTIWQPWASLVMIGAKPYEFRRWDYRERAPKLEGQRIVIHAGARPVKLAEVEDIIARMEDRLSSLRAEVAMPLLERLRAASKCRGVVELSAGLGTAILGKPKSVTSLFSSPAVSRRTRILELAVRSPEGGSVPDLKLKPLAIDLFCGLGGWTEGLLAEGYDVIGFDIERHEYGDHRYPGMLVIQDVRMLHGSQFKNAALIVASPPCQEYSYMAMPWKIAKAKAKSIREDTTGEKLVALNRLFNECFRIQREASFTAGRHIPLIVENVKGAQPWVGRARWSFGSFYLWGDVPALMPVTVGRLKLKGGDVGWRERGPGRQLQDHTIKNAGGSCFNIAHSTTSGKGQNPDGRKTGGAPHVRDGENHTKHLTNPNEHGLKQPGINLSEVGFNVANAREFSHMVEGAKYQRTDDDKRQHIGVNRKFASAMIAKIPLLLSRHIAATFR